MNTKKYFGIASVVLLMYVLIPLLLGNNPYVMGLLVAALIFGGVALAWALLGNLGGMVSFGHAAFFGVGAYVSAILTMKHGFPVMVAIPLGGIGAFVASLAMLPVLRLRGPYFALAILAYAHIFKIIATEWTSMTNGSGGLLSIPYLPEPYLWFYPEAGATINDERVIAYKIGAYLIILTIVALFAWIYHLIRKSDYGTALRAMHESEDATRVVGVNSTLLKALILFVSAFMTGVVGAFNAHYINFLDPDFAFSGGLWVTIPIVAAIFGGYRTIIGPLLGALVIYLVDQLVFKNLMPSGHQLILGVLLGAMVLLSPGGLLPLIYKLARRKNATA